MQPKLLDAIKYNVDSWIRYENKKWTLASIKFCEISITLVNNVSHISWVFLLHSIYLYILRIGLKFSSLIQLKKITKIINFLDF